MSVPCKHCGRDRSDPRDYLVIGKCGLADGTDMVLAVRVRAFTVEEAERQAKARGYNAGFVVANAVPYEGCALATYGEFGTPDVYDFDSEHWCWATASVPAPVPTPARGVAVLRWVGHGPRGYAPPWAIDYPDGTYGRSSTIEAAIAVAYRKGCMLKAIDEDAGRQIRAALEKLG